MAQFVRPVADTSISTYTDQLGGTTNIFQAIDEVTQDNADFIKTPNGPSNLVAVFAGGGVAAADAGTCTLRAAQAKLTSGGSSVIDITIEFREGTTVLATAIRANAGTAITVITDTFDASEVTNWANVNFRVLINQASGSARDAGVYQLEVETPDDSGGGGDATATPGVIAAVASLPGASASAGASASPATIQATSALPSASASAGAGASVTPATIAAIAALPAASATSEDSATALPGVIAAIAALPGASGSAGGSVAPEPIVIVAALPAATVSSDEGEDATATPAVIQAVASLPQALFAAGATAMPDVIRVFVTLPGATFPIPVFIFRTPSTMTLPSLAISEVTGDFESHPGYPLFKHFGPRGPVGKTVIKEGDTWSIVSTPSSRQLEQADRYYLGGHVYTITDPIEVAELRDAGFELEEV